MLTKIKKKDSDSTALIPRNLTDKFDGFQDLVEYNRVNWNTFDCSITNSNAVKLATMLYRITHELYSIVIYYPEIEERNTVLKEYYSEVLVKDKFISVLDLCKTLEDLSPTKDLVVKVYEFITNIKTKHNDGKFIKDSLHTWEKNMKDLKLLRSLATGLQLSQNTHYLADKPSLSKWWGNLFSIKSNLQLALEYNV